MMEKNQIPDERGRGGERRGGKGVHLPRGRKQLSSVSSQDKLEIQTQLNKNRHKQSKKQLQPLKTVSFVMEGLDSPVPSADDKEDALRKVGDRKKPSPPSTEKRSAQSTVSHKGRHLSLRDSYLNQQNNSNSSPKVKRRQRTRVSPSKQSETSSQDDVFTSDYSQDDSKHSQPSKHKQTVGRPDMNTSMNESLVTHKDSISGAQSDNSLAMHKVTDSVSGATELAKLDGSTEQSVTSHSLDSRLPASVTINLYLNQDGQATTTSVSPRVVQNTEAHPGLNLYVQTDGVQAQVSPRKKSQGPSPSGHSPLRRRSHSPPRIYTDTNSGQSPGRPQGYPSRNSSQSPARHQGIRNQSRSPPHNIHDSRNRNRSPHEVYDHRTKSRSPIRNTVHRSRSPTHVPLYPRLSRVDESLISGKLLDSSRLSAGEPEDRQINILVVDHDDRRGEGGETEEYYDLHVRESRRREKRHRRSMARNLPPLQHDDEAIVNHTSKVEQWLRHLPAETLERLPEHTSRAREEGDDEVFESHTTSHRMAAHRGHSLSAISGSHNQLKQRPEIFKRKPLRTADTLEAIRYGMLVEELGIGRSPEAWSPAPPPAQASTGRRLTEQLDIKRGRARHRSLSPLKDQKAHREHKRHAPESSEQVAETIEVLQLGGRLNEEDLERLGGGVRDWKRTTIHDPISITQLWNLPPDIGEDEAKQRLPATFTQEPSSSGIYTQDDNTVRNSRENEESSDQIREPIQEANVNKGKSDVHSKSLTAKSTCPQFDSGGMNILQKAAEAARKSLEKDKDRNPSQPPEDSTAQSGTHDKEANSQSQQHTEESAVGNSGVLESSVFGDSGFQSQDGSQLDGPLELEEDEVYIVYLQTEAGATIGPLLLEINTTEIGLPKDNKQPDRKTRLSQVQEEEEEEEEGIEEDKEESVDKDICDKTEQPIDTSEEGE